MNEEIKQRWVGALRSGEYRQGKQALCRTDNEQASFCCLGVLCDLMKNEVNGSWQDSGPNTTVKWRGFFVTAEGLYSSRLPWSLRDMAEVPKIAETTLVNMNDKGHSFTQIADWIEKEL